MARSSHRPVRDQIPPEARRRARRAGFSADADWYAGRDYVPPRPDEAPSGPPQHDKALAEARARFRKQRKDRRHDRIREIKAWFRGWAGGLTARVAHLLASRRAAGHR